MDWNSIWQYLTTQSWILYIILGVYCFFQKETQKVFFIYSWRILGGLVLLQLDKNDGLGFFTYLLLIVPLNILYIVIIGGITVFIKKYIFEYKNKNLDLIKTENITNNK